MFLLVDQIAEILYSGDAPVVPWNQAMPEDRSYYTSVAEVVLDTFTTYFENKNSDFGGHLTPAIELIALESEAARLKRLAV